MMVRLRPPALDLPDQAAVRWTSFTKIIREPEKNWPAQIYERAIIADRVGARTMALIADPEAAKTVLTGPQDLFPKWRIYERVIGSGSGREGLPAVSGGQWRRQRRAFSPMFRPEIADRLVPLFRSAAERSIAVWRKRGLAPRLDLTLEMTQLTLGIIWQVLFGADLQAEAPRFVTDAASRIYDGLLSGDVNAPPRVLAELATVAARRPPAPGIVPDNPFVAWSAIGDSGCGPPQPLTARELYDNARAILGAGHDTTALTLTWALWLIAQDRETQQRVHDEIDRAVGGGPVEDIHVPLLTFTGHVLSETLRLFPSALVTVRQSRDPIVLAALELPAATVLTVCIYALHRHRDLWNEPDLFWPDRFGAGEPNNRFAYMPFSVGPHACIGASLARREAIVILATILQQFRVTTDAAVHVKPHMSITLRPDRPVPLFLHERK
jgi:cytochrome P450